MFVGLGSAEVREVVENGRFLRQEAPHIDAKRSGESVKAERKVMCAVEWRVYILPNQVG